MVKSSQVELSVILLKVSLRVYNTNQYQLLAWLQEQGGETEHQEGLE